MITNILPKKDLWHSLIGTNRPILLYGMGNGADKVWTVLEHYGIQVSGVFASDDFVRGQCFHGTKVMTFREATEKNPDPIILICFASSRPEVMDTVHKVSMEAETYIPDVPVCGEELFDREFVSAHIDELDAVRALLTDEESKELFDRMIQVKLGGQADLLKEQDQSFVSILRERFQSEKWKNVWDIGAYTGDTLSDILSISPSLQTITLLEPDPHSYKRLSENAVSLSDQYPDVHINPIHAASWSENSELTFHVGGSRSSGLAGTGKTKCVSGIACDTLLSEQPVDFIKIDVEGAEEETLTGMTRTIERDHPDICIPLYHRSRDLYYLPMLLHSLHSYRHYSLKRLPGFPAWDLFWLASDD